MIKTNFLSDEVQKQNEHYSCIACITIDSVKSMEKKNYPQGYLEECKYKMKRVKMTKFMEAELESESESEFESEIELELKSETEKPWVVAYYFERVEKLVVILLTPNKSKTY